MVLVSTKRVGLKGCVCVCDMHQECVVKARTEAKSPKQIVYMSKKQIALSTIPYHVKYVLKSSNNSQVKIMVSQKDVGRSNMDIRNIKRDAGELQASTGSERVGGGVNYRMASYTS